MSMERDVKQAPTPGGDDAEARGTSGRWVRARQSLRVPGALLRLVARDPQHIPERLTIYVVDRRSEGARRWAQRVRDAAPDASRSALVEVQRPTHGQHCPYRWCDRGGRRSSSPSSPPTLPSCSRRFGFISVWRRSMGTT
jgi:hypothetical protein